MAPQVLTATPEVARAVVPRCLHCGRPFVKNRVDKLYCSPQCQNPGFHSRAILDQTKKAHRDLTTLDRRQSMAELASAFEAATGTPMFIRLENLPRRRSFKAVPDLNWEDTTRRGFYWGREEQGELWWNVGGGREEDPIETERRLLARDPGPAAHQGETEAEWRARGGQVKIMPSGKAIAL